MLKLLKLFLIAVIPFSALAQGSATTTAPPVKILFIGNSFMYNNNLPAIEENLAATAGIKVDIDAKIALGQSVDFFIHDQSCWDKIKSKQWDYIIFQDYQGYYYDSFGKIDSFDYKDKKALPIPLVANNLKFQDSIKKLIPCVKIIYFAGWEQCGGVPSRFPGDTTVKLIARILANYKYLNDMPGVNNLLAPIGAAYIASIDQKPYLGVWSKTAKQYLFDHDGRHPGYAGSYLTAYVLYAMLFHRSPVDLKDNPGLVPQDLDAFLKKTAWQAVKDSFAYTNLASVTPVIKKTFFGKNTYRTSKKYASYQWYDGNEQISGATHRRFKAGKKDDLANCWVETTDTKGCTYTSFPIQSK